MKNKKEIAAAITDPEQIYKTPEDVLEDASLSQSEKEKILESWKLNQNALLEAESENMSENSKFETADAADVMQDIFKAKEKLK